MTEDSNRVSRCSALTADTVGHLRREIFELAAQHVPGRSLEGPFYTSESVLQADLDAVFAKSWVFAATSAEVPEPGDYVILSFDRHSVIIVRDDDGTVLAMHNVCRHRGARILHEDRGSVGNLVCGYHRWTYAKDGRLLYAPTQGKELDQASFSLRSIAIEDIHGLIFICLAHNPPEDFHDVVDVISPYIAPHQLRKTKVAAQMDLVEEGNWKLVMENNRECYHCDGHPDLGCSAFPTYGYEEAAVPPHLKPAYERYVRAQGELESCCRKHNLPYKAVEELDSRVSGFRIQREALDGAGESFSKTGRVVSHKLMGDLAIAPLGRLSMHLQPNSWFHFLSDHAVTFSALPVNAAKTLVRTTWLVHEDAVEGVDYDVATLTDVWRQTNIQDASFVARAQLGVSSPAYEPGPYLPSEYQVDAFCNWYLTRLREHLARD